MEVFDTCGIIGKNLADPSDESIKIELYFCQRIGGAGTCKDDLCVAGVFFDGKGIMTNDAVHDGIQDSHRA